MGSAAHRIAAPHRSQGVAVLLVEDDPETLESTGRILRYFGAEVHEATTGVAALDVVRSQPLDLALIDNRLPDISGLDVAKVFRAEHIALPWVLVSAFMDYDVAVEAGKLDALRAVSSPYDPEEVVVDALARIAERRQHGWPRGPVRPRLRPFHSSVEECASLIWRACDSEDDIRTIADWGRAVGKGYSTLRALFRRTGIEPEAAKDFARILRALAVTGGRVASVESQLRSWDERTVRPLLECAGLGAPSTPTVLTFGEYLIVQRFIRGDHVVLEALNGILVID